MKTAQAQAVLAPPSLLGSLRAGFDATANHLGLLLIPVALDLFLWLGPHIRLDELIDGIISGINQQAGIADPETAELLQLSGQYWLLLGERLNLFSAFRSYPVGIPSLMVVSQPITTPYGSPVAWQMPSLAWTIGLWLILFLTGLLIGTVYFSLVSQVILTGKLSLRETLSRLPWASLQVIKLALYFIVFVLLLTLPLSCLASLLFLTGLQMGQVSMVLFLTLAAWMVLPFLFSPHGIFILHIPARASVRESFRLVRATLPKTVVFFLLIVVIDEGLSILWLVPEGHSWLTFISLLGHAFVVTGLVAASFVYYRDANRWLQRLLQQAQLSSIS
jgi:hypothetical protein